MESFLLIIVIFMLAFLIYKSLKKTIDEANITERLGNLENHLTKDLGNFQYGFTRSLQEDFERLKLVIERHLFQINEKVNSRIDENFEKTNRTFQDIVGRLSKIDEAQKKIANRKEQGSDNFDEDIGEE